jgi:hypothetical protein
MRLLFTVHSTLFAIAVSPAMIQPRNRTGQRRGGALGHVKDFTKVEGGDATLLFHIFLPPMSLLIADVQAQLAVQHCDPFDCMLIARAIVDGLL